MGRVIALADVFNMKLSLASVIVVVSVSIWVTFRYIRHCLGASLYFACFVDAFRYRMFSRMVTLSASRYDHCLTYCSRDWFVCYALVIVELGSTPLSAHSGSLRGVP
jgi:hypothetical protein